MINDDNIVTAKLELQLIASSCFTHYNWPRKHNQITVGSVQRILLDNETRSAQALSINGHQHEILHIIPQLLRFLHP